MHAPSETHVTGSGWALLPGGGLCNPTGVSFGLTSCYGRFWKRGVGGRWGEAAGRQAGRRDRAQAPCATSRHVFIIQVSLSLQVPIIIPATMVFASVYVVLVPIRGPSPARVPVCLPVPAQWLPGLFPVCLLLVPAQCLQVVTLHLQLLMEVAPTTKNAD